MPGSIDSRISRTIQRDESEEDSEDEGVVNEQVAEAIRNAYRNAFQLPTEPYSPLETPNLESSHASDADLRHRLAPPRAVDERSALLSSEIFPRSALRSRDGTPSRGMRRTHSMLNSIRSSSRRGSNARSLRRPFWTEPVESQPAGDPAVKASRLIDDRVWYDQFTSTDWVRDSIADAHRVKELRKRKDIRGRIEACLDGAQGWALVAIIGCLTAGIAYLIDVSESFIFDLKTGYCSSAWYHSKRQCCHGDSTCGHWQKWSALLGVSGADSRSVDFAVFVTWAVLLAALSCWVTLQTKTKVSPAVALSTLDENLGAESTVNESLATSLFLQSSSKFGEGLDANGGQDSPTAHLRELAQRPPLVYYPAGGSGVAEVRVLLSGFVLHGYLGVQTLFCKAVGLVLAVASGMSLGKEGPFVHIATCIGNITSRIFAKYRNNDAKRRELLSASAAAGVAVAFGSPLGGVLFSLEEVSYYFPPKTLFRTFFCCIAAALSLKFLNPYGTNQIVLFEVRYDVDWKIFEMVAFVILGVAGGALGACFIKASRFWAKTFRRNQYIKSYPMVEVLVVAIVTGVVTFWHRFTRLPVAELLYELAAPCEADDAGKQGLCPTEAEIPGVIRYLFIAFVIKAILTTVTFGIKVPAGIYVPSMTVGALFGRMMGHSIQYLILKYPSFPLFSSCPADGRTESCVVPGVYALVAAGATMCGVTRLSVTLAVILFELTGSLEHVLPFSIGVLTAKWTADAIEPLSVYDLLTAMNSYPFLSHAKKPVFDADIGEITAPPNPKLFIDISRSPLVPATMLRSKLDFMHLSGELDGGFPILCDGVLVGLIAGPDLEFALDRLDQEEGTFCLMKASEPWARGPASFRARNRDLSASLVSDVDPEDQLLHDSAVGDDDDPTDFTRYVDPAPVALDISSPMDLVYECFVKLGLRFICVLRNGKFAGLVHKKVFVRYVKHVEEQ